MTNEATFDFPGTSCPTVTPVHDGFLVESSVWELLTPPTVMVTPTTTTLLHLTTADGTTSSRTLDYTGFFPHGATAQTAEGDVLALATPDGNSTAVGYWLLRFRSDGAREQFPLKLTGLPSQIPAEPGALFLLVNWADYRDYAHEIVEIACR